MPDDGAAAIATGIEHNLSLQTLDLQHNQITDTGARALYLQGFSANLQRRILLSDGNALTPGCKIMVVAIAQAHALRQCFAKDLSHLATLDFQGRDLRQYGAAAIRECLAAHPTSACTSLDLGRNHLGDDGAAEVARLLGENTHLTRLVLDDNGIGDVGAFALANGLRANTSLTMLSLRVDPTHARAQPSFTESGLDVLAQAIALHPTLLAVDLRGHVLSRGATHALATMLSSNPRLQQLNGVAPAAFLARHSS